MRRVRVVSSWSGGASAAPSRSSRRGYTLIELIVSMALLAIVVSVASRLLFTSDRALGAESDRAIALGQQGELLSDLGRDLRGASAASGGNATLTVGNVIWRSSEDGTVRSVAGRPEMDLTYPHVRATFRIEGPLVTVRLSSEAGTAETAFYPRG